MVCKELCFMFHGYYKCDSLVTIGSGYLALELKLTYSDFQSHRSPTAHLRQNVPRRMAENTHAQALRLVHQTHFRHHVFPKQMKSRHLQSGSSLLCEKKCQPQLPTSENKLYWRFILNSKVHTI